MPSRGSIGLVPRTRKGLVLFWAALFALTLALQYTAAALPPSALALSGAVYTSNQDGTVINANHYPSKPDVYLTGGPCQGGSHLAPGTYYFQISDPSAGDLLSTDAIGNRMFTVGANGFISGTSGTHNTFAIACTGENGVTIQLIPFADTSNGGGEYKLTIATATTVEACAGFSAASTTFMICSGADQKSDNFKVLGPGGLEVTKTVTGAPDGFSGSFPISVDCGGAGTFARTIVFPTPGLVTIAPIDSGATCTVTEGALPTPPTDYAWDAPSYTNNGASIVSGQTTTIGVNNTMHFVANPGFTVDKGVSLSAAGPFVASLNVTTGATLHYRITITNTGNVVLTGVTLSDNTYDLVAKGCVVPTTLAVGAHFDCDYTATAGTGTTTNVATGDTAETGPDTGTATVVATAPPPTPTLIIDKTNNAPIETIDGVGLPTVNEGATITFTLAYTFTGAMVDNGTIRDVLPVGLTYVEGSATSNDEFSFIGYDSGTRTLSWDASSVTKSGSVSYLATVDAGAAELAQPLRNVATVASDGTDSATADSVVFVPSTPLGETSAPTAPATDTVGPDPTSTSGTSVQLILMALAGLAFLIVSVTPVSRSYRARNRRR
jgi:uncharacterized repeat protein (TIGR01451 family)